METRVYIYYYYVISLYRVTKRQCQPLEIRIFILRETYRVCARQFTKVPSRSDERCRKLIRDKQTDIHFDILYKDIDVINSLTNRNCVRLIVFYEKYIITQNRYVTQYFVVRSLKWTFLNERLADVHFSVCGLQSITLHVN